MDSTAFSRIDYYQTYSLSLLQAESQQWLEEIVFWKEEVAFYADFFRQKKEDKAYPRPEIEELEKELRHIGHYKLARLEKEVKQHEQSINGEILNSTQAEDNSLSARHRILHRELYNMHNLIRNFKQNVFLFVQKHRSFKS